MHLDRWDRTGYDIQFNHQDIDRAALFVSLFFRKSLDPIGNRRLYPAGAIVSKEKRCVDKITLFRNKEQVDLQKLALPSPNLHRQFPDHPYSARSRFQSRYNVLGDIADYTLVAAVEGLGDVEIAHIWVWNPNGDGYTLESDRSRTGLEVIGSGFGRTGTGSLKRALEQLGFGPCHHSFGRPEQTPYWREALAGRPMNWDEVFAGYRSQVDWPGAHFWRELAAAYPQAKVIHTMRPDERWWKSFSATIAVVLSNYQNMPLKPASREYMQIAAEIVGARTIGSALDDREAALAAYRKHNQEVLASIPRERLLVFEPSQGWEPLCRFLERPAPARPFPHANATDDWWRKWPTKPAQ